MKFVALISGGKDSCFNIIHCVANGHEPIALANLQKKTEDKSDELDSYMYQTIGHNIIPLYADAMDLPLYTEEISGTSLSTDSTYLTTENDEVEDLYRLLQKVKAHHPDLEGVSSGAILSNYQRVRVEHVCDRLGLISLAYLWRRDQSELMEEMIRHGQVEAVIVKVAAMGLGLHHLGKTLLEMQPILEDLHKKYDVHVCGEGGEFETLTLDTPLFKKRIVLDQCEQVIHSNDAFAIVAYLHIARAHLEVKPEYGVSDELSQFLVNSNDIQISPSKIIEEKELLSSIISRRPEYTLPSAELLTPDSVTGIACNSNVSKVNSYLFIPGTISIKASHMEAETADIFTQIRVTVYVASMEDFSQLNSSYKSLFSVNPPPRVTVATNLAHLKRSVQIDVIAASNSLKSTMHVQGMSYWAPANIGPYSQAVALMNSQYQYVEMYIAGQIGMIPANLTVANDFVQQVHLSLYHVGSIISAGYSLPKDADVGILTCVCYMINISFSDYARECWSALFGDRIPICFVEIVALPKFAQIEWQVVGTNCEFAREFQRMDGIDWSLSTCCSNFIMMGVALLLTSNVLNTFQQLKDIAVDARNAFIIILKGANSKLSNILLIRVFYVAGLPLDWVQRICTETFNDEIAFTYVKVEGMDRGLISWNIHVIVDKVIR